MPRRFRLAVVPGHSATAEVLERDIEIPVPSGGGGHAVISTEYPVCEDGPRFTPPPLCLMC